MEIRKLRKGQMFYFGDYVYTRGSYSRIKKEYFVLRIDGRLFTLKGDEIVNPI